MAVLIGRQLLKLGDRIAKGEHWIGQTLVPWHVSIGTLLLGVLVLRILWVVSLQRRHRPQQNPATALLVKAGHGLLYAGLLLPVTGVLTKLGGGYGLTAFELEIVGKGDKIAWASTLGSLHSPVAGRSPSSSWDISASP